MRPTTVSLFCGAGGESLGRHLAFEELGLSAQDTLCHAINHWDLAVATHGLNLPAVLVHQEDIARVTAKTYGLEHIDLLWASPSCIHHSRARGGKPREEQQRSHAWEVVDRWLRVARVDVLLVENVPEFEQWGPLDDAGQPIRERKGEDFRAFVGDLRSLGYAVEWRVLCAADYGDPTTRRRFFLQATRDGHPIVWPEPTHRDPRKPATLQNRDLPPWRSVASCIDFSLPCPSIFDRKRPLAEATLRRIATGVVRFVLQGKPFLVTCNHADPSFRGQSVDQKHGLVSAFLARHYGGVVGRGLDEPTPTVTAIDHHSLVEAQLGTEGTARAKLVAAFLTHYYSSGGTSQSPGLPLHTVTTIAKHGLVTVEIDGESYVVTDLGLRMLEPLELARAMGFPDWYRWERSPGVRLSKRDAVKMIGNACPVGTVRAIVKAVVLQRPGVYGLARGA